MTDSTWELLTNPADPRHGTITAYGYHGCRCARCKAANAAAQQEARDRRQKAISEVPPEVHGSENGYSNYRCRCTACKAAHAVAARAKRED
jgi:hypothetical protein